MRQRQRSASSQRRTEALLRRLSKQFGDRLRTDDEARERACRDESSVCGGMPAAVVWPQSTAEVVAVAQEAYQLKIALVPRGAGTGRSGGCVPRTGDVVVDLSRMQRILELNTEDRFAVVEPGLVTLELDRAASEEGLMYPPDPSSLESCTIGGNIATNAGGARALKYGVTGRYVWGLEIVLAGGRVVRMGRRTIKAVAGYDVTSVLVGSEGTLGFITEATMHLTAKPQVVETAWLSFADVEAATQAAVKGLARGTTPSTLELLDATSLAAVRSNSPFPIPEAAGACLLVETDGAPEQAVSELERLAEVMLAAGATDSAVARSNKQREAMRRARRLVSPALKERFAIRVADDVAVPRSRMLEMFARARHEGEEEGLQVCLYGHVGDGNVHINLLGHDCDQREAASRARARILRHAIQLGGTVSGEHGLGVAKRDYLMLEHSPELLALEWHVKRAFDPKGMMNPGKALPKQ